MASSRPAEAQDEIVAARAHREAADRRRWRRAVAAAAIVHLMILLMPRPRPELAAPADPGDHRVFLLREVRPAPPEPPPPVVPALPDEVEVEPVEEEQSASPPGPPPPPRVEVLFPEGELSRLAPPRPLEVVAPPTPPEAPAEGGEVRVYLQLDERGRVYGVRGATGDPALLEAAQTAARSWRFFPATLDGEAIPVVVEVIVRFPPRREDPAATPPPPPA